jgi:hypothetical protein
MEIFPGKKGYKMKELKPSFPTKIIKIITICVIVTSVLELALSQFIIKITRLSTEETTGISIFAFIILSLITVFAVTRMKKSIPGTLFAIIISFITAVTATWYLKLLLSDEIFFRNLYYIHDRRTQTYELLPLTERITASIPIAAVFLGAVVFYLSAFAIAITNFAGWIINPGKKTRE